MLTARSATLAAVVVLAVGATGGCDAARAVIAPGPGGVVMPALGRDTLPVDAVIPAFAAAKTAFTGAVKSAMS